MSSTTSTTQTTAQPVGKPDAPSVLMTGIKPTGPLHLGNLLGAIRPFLRHQQDHQNPAANTSLFGVMDLHALTVQHDPRQVRDTTMQTYRLLLACGIDPHQTVLFVQSHIPEHTEMSYLLECVAHVGELERMIQFKEKSASTGNDGTRFSLLSYPVLMAADVLLYRTQSVPVGEDQRQHLELARTIANRFNRRYGKTLTVPRPEVPTTAARVMNLANPTGKMGKSNQTDAGTIHLLDSPAQIRRKISRAVTDQDAIVQYDPTRKPGVSNLLNLHAALAGITVDQAQSTFTSYAGLKQAVTDEVLDLLDPIRTAYERQDGKEIRTLMTHGAARARSLAAPTVADTKRALGLL